MKQKLVFVILLILFMACTEIPAPDAAGKSRGFTIFLWNSRNQFIPENFSASVNKIKNMGANTIILCPYLFVTNSSDPMIKPGPDTISNSDLTNAIRIIRTNNLKIGLKPHINCLDGTARWKWLPTDRATAKSNYIYYFSQYASMAENEGADYFIVGTELDNVAAIPNFFRDVITEIRKLFHGKITYASSYNHFAEITFWDKCDYIGINAWLYLSDEKIPTVDSLLFRWGEWNSLFSYYASYFNKDIFFTEIGYYCAEKCAKDPGNYAAMTVRSEKAQANCFFAALHNFALQERVIGLTIWNWELNIGTNKIRDFTPENNMAENTIKALWTGQ